MLPGPRRSAKILRDDARRSLGEANAPLSALAKRIGLTHHTFLQWIHDRLRSTPELNDRITELVGQWLDSSRTVRHHSRFLTGRQKCSRKRYTDETVFHQRAVDIAESICAGRTELDGNIIGRDDVIACLGGVICPDGIQRWAFEISAIVGHRIVDAQELEYLVVWRNWSIAHASWVSAAHMMCPELQRDYHTACGLAPPPLPRFLTISAARLAQQGLPEECSLEVSLKSSSSDPPTDFVPFPEFNVHSGAKCQNNAFNDPFLSREASNLGSQSIHFVNHESSQLHVARYPIHVPWQLSKPPLDQFCFQDGNPMQSCVQIAPYSSRHNCFESHTVSEHGALALQGKSESICGINSPTPQSTSLAIFPPRYVTPAMTYFSNHKGIQPRTNMHGESKRNHKDASQLSTQSNSTIHNSNEINTSSIVQTSNAMTQFTCTHTCPVSLPNGATVITTTKMSHIVPKRKNQTNTSEYVRWGNPVQIWVDHHKREIDETANLTCDVNVHMRRYTYHQYVLRGMWQHPSRRHTKVSYTPPEVETKLGKTTLEKSTGQHEQSNNLAEIENAAKRRRKNTNHGSKTPTGRAQTPRNRTATEDQIETTDETTEVEIDVNLSTLVRFRKDDPCYRVDEVERYVVARLTRVSGLRGALSVDGNSISTLPGEGNKDVPVDNYHRSLSVDISDSFRHPSLAGSIPRDPFKLAEKKPEMNHTQQHKVSKIEIEDHSRVSMEDGFSRDESLIGHMTPQTSFMNTSYHAQNMDEYEPELEFMAVIEDASGTMSRGSEHETEKSSLLCPVSVDELNWTTENSEFLYFNDTDEEQKTMDSS